MKKLENFIPFVVVGLIVIAIIGFMSYEKEPEPPIKMREDLAKKIEENSRVKVKIGEAANEQEVEKQKDSSGKNLVTLTGPNGEKMTMSAEDFKSQMFKTTINEMKGTISKIEHNTNEPNKVVFYFTNKRTEVFPNKDEEIKQILANGTHGLLAHAGYVGAKEPVEFDFIDHNGNSLGKYISKETTKILR